MAVCDCGERIRRYAAELEAWGMAVGKVDVRGGHALHDADHYRHAARIADGHEPTLDESFDPTGAAYGIAGPS